MTRRAAAMRAIRRLWNCDPVESEDEIDFEEIDEAHNEEDVADVESISSSESEEDSQTGEIQEFESSNSSNSDEEVINQQAIAKDGTVWTKIDNWQNAGRIPNRNLFTKTPGVKAFAKRKTDSPLSAWRLLFTEKMVKLVVDCTNEKGKEDDPSFVVTREEIEGFIGLLYMRGALHLRRADVRDLFSKEFGCPFFNSTMSRDKFCAIMKNLRFDKKTTRRARVQTDLFAPIRELFDEFVSNSIQVYQSHPFLTIDEQLLPSKNRCKFFQFMASKPDKYEIKIWLLVDVKTHYCVNQIPYLGRDEERGGEAVGQHVVKKLVDPIQGCGYNVTADNFFTSAPVAKHLLAKKITYVGTVRKTSRSLPGDLNRLTLHQSEFYKSDDVLLVNYQCKANNNVLLMSTFHCTPRISAESNKEKPEIVLTYNQTKTGVDCLDQMTRLYSTKAASRRWPISVFYDLLDKALINSQVLYQEAVGPIVRKRFLMEIAKALCDPLQKAKKQKGDRNAEEVKARRKRATCCASGCENKTCNVCDTCGKLFCGKHGTKVRVETLKCSYCTL